MSVAQIINDQIRAMDKWAFIRWGAKDKVAYPNGLKFKTSGLVKWKGYVFVKYDEGMDLYDIQFFRIRKFEVKMDKELKGVYFDQLIEVIDAQVG